VSQLQISHVHVDDLIPYENNPRDNTQAIAAVRASIEEFGFLVPVVVDENNVIVAGHTRYAAVRQLCDESEENAAKYAAIPCVVATGLTEEQVTAFRLIDNKTSELATWNFDLLAGEISALHDSGIPLTNFGWSQEEIDCLNSVVSSDCLLDTEAAAMVAEGAQPMGHVPRDRTRTKDGTGVRITFGELGFFVDLEDYKVWYDELMKMHEYDPRGVIEHVAEQMGLLPAKLARDERVKSGEISPEAEEAFDPVAGATAGEQAQHVEA
jgi:hypothetical protein